MRTTLTIRDELYEKIRRQAFDERRTLGDVVNGVVVVHGGYTARKGQQKNR